MKFVSLLKNINTVRVSENLHCKQKKQKNNIRNDGRNILIIVIMSYIFNYVDQECETNIFKCKYILLSARGEHVKFSKCNISIKQTIVSTLAVKVLTPHSIVRIHLNRFVQCTHTFRLKRAVLCKEDGHDKI